MSEITKIQNILTLLRLPILAIVIYLLSKDEKFLVLIFLLLSVLTDILDGYIARKRGEHMGLGRVLDHVVDKVFFNSLSVTLYLLKNLPLFFVLILLIRDFLIIFLGYFLLKKSNVLTSNLYGKLAGFTLSLLFVSYIFELNYRESLIFISLFFIFLASIVYFKTFLLYIRGK
ncbi:MAG: CDP-alcohol phosphatidyltransferase family protein [Candidatus Hydrothermales bacterium]